MQNFVVMEISETSRIVIDGYIKMRQVVDGERITRFQALHELLVQHQEISRELMELKGDKPKTIR